MQRGTTTTCSENTLTSSILAVSQAHDAWALERAPRRLERAADPFDARVAPFGLLVLVAWRTLAVPLSPAIGRFSRKIEQVFASYTTDHIC